MHWRWRSTMSLHAAPESAASSAFEPYWRKQSSRAFFVSGQAQQLAGRGSYEVSRGSFTLASRPGETHGLRPSGFLGLSFGLAASEPERGLPVSGWRETGPEDGGGGRLVEGPPAAGGAAGAVDAEEKGHIV